eukprot:366578-Chlamydomonas_euryale.AAC.9
MTLKGQIQCMHANYLRRPNPELACKPPSNAKPKACMHAVAARTLMPGGSLPGGSLLDAHSLRAWRQTSHPHLSFSQSFHPLPLPPQLPLTQLGPQPCDGGRLLGLQQHAAPDDALRRAAWLQRARLQRCDGTRQAGTWFQRHAGNGAGGSMHALTCTCRTVHACYLNPMGLHAGVWAPYVRWTARQRMPRRLFCKLYLNLYMHAGAWAPHVRWTARQRLRPMRLFSELHLDPPLPLTSFTGP